jgi:miniconductance mechanosensitive channel
MLDGLNTFFQNHPLVETGAWALGLILLAWLADNLTKRYLLKVINRIVVQTRFTWDDALQKRRVFRRLAHVAPAMVIYYGAPMVPGVPTELADLVRQGCLAFIVVMVVMAADRLLTAVNDIYSTRPEARSRPIKGYIQIVKIILYIAAGIVAVATLLGQPPTLLLGGFGAMTAVILLVFRDTILSVVASVQITQYDMIEIGDWIEMPQYGADGDVVDIALHTIRVQNWDKTITTIPTHKFIEDSFKNWKGMKLSGGRRIMRSVHLDVTSIRFLTPEEIEAFSRWELLKDYMREKVEEIEAYNAGKEGEKDLVPEARHLTNVGTLRAYIVNYLRNHPGIHQGMTLIVRQLEPGPQGLPMQIYTFSNDTNWVRYEALQSDIFDHILATLPEFGLLAYQAPSGADILALKGGDGQGAAAGAAAS